MRIILKSFLFFTGFILLFIAFGGNMKNLAKNLALLVSEKDSGCFENYLNQKVIEKIADDEKSFLCFVESKRIITDNPKLSTDPNRFSKIGFSFFNSNNKKEELEEVLKKNLDSWTGEFLFEHHYENSDLSLPEKIEKLIEIKKTSSKKKIELIIKIDSLFFKINEEKFSRVNTGFTW